MISGGNWERNEEDRVTRKRDHARLLRELGDEYARRFPTSARLNKRAENVLVDGGSHALRLMRPFPPRPVRADGAWILDEDGHRILDFWQGHHANILGHNPRFLTDALARYFQDGQGLLTGFTDRLQVEVAELLCRTTGAERVRFTTSGTLATMYAILLARGYTGRNIVLKVGGGWHGAQPWGLKGVHFEGNIGFQGMETAGLPDAMDAQVVVTRYNDAEMLEDRFRGYGDRIACFIVEPFIGAGGMLPAAPEFLRTARALTARYGAVLIFDEIVSGFRFRAGDTGRMYGVQPDLAAFGKVIGGGMPVAAVGGRAEIMALAGRKGGMRVAFSGGTYSGHPASLLAAKTMLEHLVAHEAEIYPRLTELAILAHRTVEKAFMDEGIYARCTGYGNEVLPESASAMLLFPYDEGVVPRSPDAARNPEICDLVLGEEVLRVAMLLEGVHVTHGLGSVTTAHTEDDLQFLGDACRRVARRIGPYLA